MGILARCFTAVEQGESQGSEPDDRQLSGEICHTLGTRSCSLSSGVKGEQSPYQEVSRVQHEDLPSGSLNASRGHRQGHRGRGETNRARRSLGARKRDAGGRTRGEGRIGDGDAEREPPELGREISP